MTFSNKTYVAFTLACLVLFIAFSCREEKQYERPTLIYGKVIKNDNGESLQEGVATIRYAAWDEFGGLIINMDSTTVDDKGRFYFDFITDDPRYSKDNAPYWQVSVSPGDTTYFGAAVFIVIGATNDIEVRLKKK